MKNSLLFASIISACFLFACTLTVKTDNDTGGSTAKIRNGIEIQENGLHAQQAFLTLEDGSLLADNNKVQVGQKVVMRLIIEGWQEENGLIFPEASEKITTDDGEVLVDEPALFEQSLPNGTPSENKEKLTLSAVINQLDKLHNYYLVSFKMWDKKSNKSLSGSYKLYI